MSLVELQEVSKAFDGVQAVDDVSFTIDRGEVVGFLGPNGAGKTTTMRIVTQFLEPDSGSVSVDGTPVRERPLEARRRIGYLPETNPLYTTMLVGEYLRYISRLRGIEGAEAASKIGRAVEQTGIEEVYYRPIGQLSKGYRQRVGLAQAILPEPDILILDEPTEGLDPNQRVEIRELITELGSERTVLLSTHVMQEVQLTCNRLLILNRGRLIADGDVDSLLSGGAHGMRITVELEAEGGPVRDALSELPGVTAVEAVQGPASRSRFEVVGAAGEDPRGGIWKLAVDRGWPLWELHLERESLEDLFRELTGSDS